MSTAAATLASTQEEDGSEDVNDFLRRIRELDDRRNREDEERTRKLQEELLKGRQEREARRAGECAYVPLIAATHVSTPHATNYIADICLCSRASKVLVTYQGVPFSDACVVEILTIP